MGATATSLVPAAERGPRPRLIDRIMTDPRFQRWATRFPLTRPIAQRRARALFDLCAGFVYAQVLLACVQLHLFEMLAEGPQTEAALAARLGLDRPAARRLLEAAVSLRLVRRARGGRYALGPLGAAVMGNGAVAAMVGHHPMLYADLTDPVALLRGTAPPTRLSRYWPYASAPDPCGLGAGATEGYTALMAASQPIVADEVLGAYRFDRHRCLLDVGGGNGAFLRAVAARAPHLRLMLFDLPAVADQARAAFDTAGLADRATTHGGSFWTEPLPVGADVVSLVRVIHDHDDPGALAILRAARAALPADGTLLLAEPIADTPGAEPVGAAYFGFYLLAMGTGRARTRAELVALLQQAGFAPPRFLPTHTPLVTSLAVARPTVTHRDVNAP
jgi:demethylspheroidene O-methyltransferase